MSGGFPSPCTGLLRWHIPYHTHNSVLPSSPTVPVFPFPVRPTICLCNTSTLCLRAHSPARPYFPFPLLSSSTSCVHFVVLVASCSARPWAVPVPDNQVRLVPLDTTVCPIQVLFPSRISLVSISSQYICRVRTPPISILLRLCCCSRLHQIFKPFPPTQY